MTNFNISLNTFKSTPREATDTELMSLTYHALVRNSGYTKTEFTPEESDAMEQYILSCAVAIFDNLWGRQIMVVLWSSGDEVWEVLEMKKNGMLTELSES
jgi:hypothetical protein